MTGGPGGEGPAVGEPGAAAPADAPRAWSRPARAVLTVVAAALVLAVAGHLGLSFLHVAPHNAATAEAQTAIDDYIYPELEQNWQLFAPNPLARNETVWARASVVSDSGDFRTTAWRDLTARDFARIRHNPAPSHVDQNLLRRAWDLYADSHDENKGEQAYDARGQLVGDYLRRLVYQRLLPEARGGDRIIRVQVRTRFELVKPPVWDTARAADRKAKPWFRTLPWWNVEPADRGEKPSPADAGGQP